MKYELMFSVWFDLFLACLPKETCIHVLTALSSSVPSDLNLFSLFDKGGVIGK